MSEIYLPIDVDHSDFEDLPNIIFIDGGCYEKIEFSSEQKTGEWYDVEEEYEECEDCLAESIQYDSCFSCNGDPSIWISASGTTDRRVEWLGGLWNLPFDSGKEFEAIEKEIKEKKGRKSNR